METLPSAAFVKYDNKTGQPIEPAHIIFSKFLLSSHLTNAALVLQSHLQVSSRRQEGSLRRKQDRQDPRPQALFTPALVAAGDRRPRPETLRQFTPGRASANDPQHAFHHQAMIDGWTTRLWLLRRQERAYLLPVLVSERRDTQQAQGSRWVCRQRGCLASTAQPMEALGSPLMLASKARPVEAVGLLLLRLAQRVQ